MKKFLIISFLLLSVILQAQISVVRRAYTTPVAEYHSTLLDGLLGYYNCDETSGLNVADALGVYNATIQSIGTIERAAGKFGNCLDYFSRNSSITVSNSLLEGRITDKLTFSCWFTLDTLPSVLGRDIYLFAAKNAAGGSIFSVRMESGDNFVCAFRGVDGTLKWAWSTAVGVSSTFRHLAVAIQGTGNTAKIYLNNVEITDSGTDEQTGNFGTIEWVQGIIIGNSYTTNADTWSGKQDEIGIWKRVVSVDSLYNANTYPFNL